MSAEPLSVTFTVEPGQVWVDPEGVAWKVKFISDGVHLERTVMESVPARTLVRQWRQMGDSP